MKTVALVAKMIVIAIVTLFVFRFVASAQQPAVQDLPIDGAGRHTIIESLAKEMEDNYIFADVAKKMSADVRAREKNKEYDAITSSAEFAKKLTTDLQAISHDKHLRVRFSFAVVPKRDENRRPTAEEIAERNSFLKRQNYGFAKVERMDGNIGVIDLRNFTDEIAGADTVAAAMAFVANTDAIIFDLRQNGGGNPDMIALISSYLFGDKPVHLNDIYFREGDHTDEFWTKPEKANRKFADKDLYVLTSNYTFSGGEEFANNLKVLKRATIIGETTGGGANPGGVSRLNDHFGAFIPVGRAINPITKTNWEGIGVEPDIKISKDLALKTAYVMALTKSLEKQKNPDIKDGLQSLIDKTRKELAEATTK